MPPPSFIYSPYNLVFIRETTKLTRTSLFILKKMLLRYRGISLFLKKVERFIFTVNFLKSSFLLQYCCKKLARQNVKNQSYKLWEISRSLPEKGSVGIPACSHLFTLPPQNGIIPGWGTYWEPFLTAQLLLLLGEVELPLLPMHPLILVLGGVIWDFSPGFSTFPARETA